jgi:hypothetical protein
MAYLGTRIDPYSYSPAYGHGLGAIDWASIVGSVSSAAASITKSIEAPYSQTTPYGSYAGPAPIASYGTGLDTGTLIMLGGAGLLIYLLMSKKKK